MYTASLRDKLQPQSQTVTHIHYIYTAPSKPSCNPRPKLSPKYSTFTLLLHRAKFQPLSQAATLKPNCDPHTLHLHYSPSEPSYSSKPNCHPYTLHLHYFPSKGVLRIFSLQDKRFRIWEDLELFQWHARARLPPCQVLFHFSSFISCA